MAKTPDARANMILRKWTAELASKDRATSQAHANFSELWYDMFVANIDFDTAYSKIDDAVAAHSPSKSVTSWVYKSHPAKSSISLRDFTEEWINHLRDVAYQAFYEFYPLEEKVKPKRKAPPSMIGGMPRQEYNRYRKYAEQFPVLTIEEINRRFEEAQNQYVEEKGNRND